MKKLKKPKKKSIKGVWRRAKTAFNRWVRYRNVPGYPPCDGVTNSCVSCGERFQMNELNAGHFYHGKCWMSAMDERNVWPQCIGCNKYKHGNLIEYSEFLRGLYGPEIIAILGELRHTPWKPNREELEKIIEEYTKKLEEPENV